MQYVLRLAPEGNLELLKGAVARRSGISMPQVNYSYSVHVHVYVDQWLHEILTLSYFSCAIHMYMCSVHVSSMK